MADPVKQLYDYFYPGNEGLGSLDEFNANLQDSTQRRKFYDYFSPNNPALGTFDDFNKRLLPSLEPPDTSLIDTSEIVPEDTVPDEKIKDRKDRKYKYDQYNPFPDVNMAIAKFEAGDRADFHNQYGAHTVPFDSTKKQYMIDNFGMEQGDPLPDDPNLFTASYPTKALGKAASDYMIKSIWEENDGNVEDFVAQYTGIKDRDSLTFKNYVNEIKYNMNSNEPSGHNTAIANSIYKKFPNLPRVEIRGSKGYVNPYGVGTPLEYLEDGYGKRVEFDTDLTTETDVMLDILHAIPTGKDILLKGMYDRFADNIVNTRGEDIEYFYEQAREENPDLPKEEFVRNYVDSQLRAVIAQEVGGASDPQYKLDYKDIKQLSPDAVKLGQDVLGYMTAYADTIPSIEEAVQPEEAVLDSYTNITSALDVKGIDLRNNKEAQKALRRNRIKTGESVTYDIKSSMPSLATAYTDQGANWDVIDFNKLLPGDVVKFGGVSHIIKDFDEIQDMAETVRFNKLQQELKDDPALVDIPFIGNTPLKAVVDKVAYQTADLFTVGLSKRWMDKPPLLEAMDISNSKIAWSDDNARMQTARLFEGIGETAGGLFQVIAALETAGMLGYGAAGTGAIGFAGLGGFRRLADPEIAMQMTPRKWVVGTGLDAILGASFPFLGRLGGEVVRTQGSNVKAFAKYLMQTGALGTAMTATQLTDQWNSWMVDNPDRTAMEGLLTVGEGVLQPANMLHTYGLMAALHATGTYTRFLPGKGRAKGKGMVVYDPEFARWNKERVFKKVTEYYGEEYGVIDAEWYSSLSGKAKADILARQFEIAGEIADGILKYDPQTGEYKPLNKPSTMAESQELLRREVIWIKKLANGEDVPFLKTEAEFVIEEIKAGKKVSEVKVEKPKVEEVVLEEPAEPVTPEEFVKQAELELEERTVTEEEAQEAAVRFYNKPGVRGRKIGLGDPDYAIVEKWLKQEGRGDEDVNQAIIEGVEGAVEEPVVEEEVVEPVVEEAPVEEVLKKYKLTVDDITSMSDDKIAENLAEDSLIGAELQGIIRQELARRQEAPAEDGIKASINENALMKKIDLAREKLSKARKAHYNIRDKEGYFPDESSETQKAIDVARAELKEAKDEYGKVTEAPAEVPGLKLGTPAAQKKMTFKPAQRKLIDKYIEDNPDALKDLGDGKYVLSIEASEGTIDAGIHITFDAAPTTTVGEEVLIGNMVQKGFKVASESEIQENIIAEAVDRIKIENKLKVEEPPAVTEEPSEIAEEPPEVRDYDLEEEIPPPKAFKLPAQEMMKVADVHLDPDRFQLDDRGGKIGFDQKRVDVMAENFDEARFTPVWVWQDPASRKFFVLAGHHRTATMKQLNYEDMPVKIFKGTEEEAIEFATTQNAHAEGHSIQSDIQAVGGMFANGKTKEYMLAQMPALGNISNVTKLINLSHLSTGGSFMQHYENNNMPGIKGLAQTVAVYRKRLGENFRDSHEQEIFDYLYMHGGYDVTNHREVIDHAIARGMFMENFEGKPLNITKPIVRSQAEVEYNERIREIEKAIRDIEKEEKKIIKRATAQKTPKDVLDKAISNLTDQRVELQTELDRMLLDMPNAMQQIRRQTNMFASKKSSPNATQKGIHDIKLLKDHKHSKNFRISDRVRDIYEHFKVPLRERGLSKRLHGLYNRISRRVRLHSSYDIIGGIHEITHALDDDLGITSRYLNKFAKDAPIRNLLTEQFLYHELYEPTKELYDSFEDYLSKKPKDKYKYKLEVRLAEGLSSFAENYLLDREFMKGRFPDIVGEITNKGGALYHPELLEMIDMFSEIAEIYEGLTLMEKGKQLLHTARKDTNKKNPHSQTFWQNLEMNIFNLHEPADRWARNLGKSSLDNPFVWSPMLQNKTIMIFNAMTGSKVGTGVVIPRYDGSIDIRDYSQADITKHFKNAAEQEDFEGGYMVQKRYMGDIHLRNEAENAFLGADAELKEFMKQYDAAELDEQVTMEAERKKLKLERDLMKKDFDHRDGKVMRDHGNTRQGVQKAIQIAKKLVDQFDAEYAEPMKMFIKIQNDLLEIAHEGGLIPEGQYDYYKDLNDKGFYAPLWRLVYDSYKDDPNSYISFADKQITKGNQYKQAHGSTLDIIPPIKAQSLMLAQAYDNALRNIYFRKLKELSLLNTDMAAGFEINTSPAKPIWEKLAPDKEGKMVGGYSISVEDQKLGKTYIKMYEDGTPIYVTLYEEFVLLSDMLNVKQLEEYGRMFGAPTRMFTRATTGWFPPFAVKNFTRDNLEAMQNTQAGFVPLFDPISFAKSYILAKIGKTTNKDMEYYREYIAQGGDKQLLMSFYNVSDDAAALKDWMEGKKRPVTKLVDSGLDFTSIPANLSEIGQRIGEYIRARESGKSQVESMHLAHQVTLPFQQHGAWWGSTGLFTIVKSFPFVNPRLLALWKLGERIRHDPKSRKRVASVVAASATVQLMFLLSSLYYLGDDERKKALLKLARTPIDILAKNFIVPGMGGDLVGFAIPDHMGTINALITMYVMNIFADRDKAEKDEDRKIGVEEYHKYSWGEYLNVATSSLPEQLVPLDFEEIEKGNFYQGVGKWIFSYQPHLMKVPAQLYANMRVFPSHGNIVPPYMKNWAKSEQYSEYTSKQSRMLAKLLNASPIQVDYFIKNGMGAAFGMFAGKFGSNPVYHGFQTYALRGRIWNKFYEKNYQVEELASLLRAGEEYPEKIHLDRFLRDKIYKKMSEAKGLVMGKYQDTYNSFSLKDRVLGTKSVFSDRYIVKMFELLNDIDEADYSRGNPKYSIRNTYDLMNRIYTFAKSAGVYLPMDKTFMSKAEEGKLSPEAENKYKEYWKRNQYIRNKMEEGETKQAATRMWKEHLRMLKARRR